MQHFKSSLDYLYLLQCESHINNVQQIQVLLFGTFCSFFLFFVSLIIFDPWLVESTNLEPVDK